MRRSLVLWGWGNLALGDRRGWALMILEPFFIAGLLLVGVQLTDGTQWLIVFVPLVALLVVWLGQAIYAYQRALRLGAAAGGEAQVALFLPVAVTLLTIYWLVGGSFGSPAATVERYALDWMSMRPADAVQLFVSPPDPSGLGATWQAEMAFLRTRIGQAADEYGPGSGLHPDSPFDNLRFGEPVEEQPGLAQVTIDIVRQEEVQTTILGFIPTASEETVSVERAGVVSLRLVPQPGLEWLPIGRLASSSWLIDSISLNGSDAP
jgi:hypothetical protein